MLQCTPAAAATLEQVRQQNQIPDGHGVRLFPAPTPQGEVGLGIDFTDAPEADDAVTEQHGTTLMVASDISDQLDGLMLDVAPDPSENGNGEPQLVLRSPEA